MLPTVEANESNSCRLPRRLVLENVHSTDGAEAAAVGRDRIDDEIVQRYFHVDEMIDEIQYEKDFQSLPPCCPPNALNKELNGTDSLINSSIQDLNPPADH